MQVFNDKTLNCIVCKKDFIFTKGEQEFFFKQGFDIPKRCPVCRKKRAGKKKKRQKKLLDALMVREQVTLEVVSVQ